MEEENRGKSANEDIYDIYRKKSSAAKTFTVQNANLTQSLSAFLCFFYQFLLSSEFFILFLSLSLYTRADGSTPRSNELASEG